MFVYIHVHNIKNYGEKFRTAKRFNKKRFTFVHAPVTNWSGLLNKGL